MGFSLCQLSLGSGARLCCDLLPLTNLNLNLNHLLCTIAVCVTVFLGLSGHEGRSRSTPHVSASNGSSMATVELGQETSDGEDSESDAPYTPELNTVFDALVELAGGYGRDGVPVRQIQAQTSLQLERLEELLEEWECVGVICRDDTRLEVACCLSVTDALEDEYLTLVCCAQIEQCSQT